jgi:hypothetical protein
LPSKYTHRFNCARNTDKKAITRPSKAAVSPITAARVALSLLSSIARNSPGPDSSSFCYRGYSNLLETEPFFWGRTTFCSTRHRNRMMRAYLQGPIHLIWFVLVCPATHNRTITHVWGNLYFLLCHWN